MKKIIPLILIFFIQPTFSFSQNGPGGVGNSSNLALWLDGEDITLSNGAAVSSWSDKSGNSNDFSAPVGLEPVFASSSNINSMPGLTFSGSEYLSISTCADLDQKPFTWYTVYNTANSSNQILLRSSNTGFSTTLWGSIQASSEYRVHGRNSSGGFVAAGTAWSSGSHILYGRWTSVSLGSLDGLSFGSSGGADASPSSGSHDETRIGSNTPSGGNEFIGDIGEVIVFKDALNTAQRAIIHNYLSSKYGVAIDAAEDFYDHDASYGIDVAGIGRQNSSNQHLTSSGEANVQISSAGMSDGDFLFWGHDGVALTSTSTNVPSIYATFSPSGRMYNRSWRITETNEVGALTISFDVSSSGFGNTATYELLVDSDDGDFTNATRITGSYASGTVTFTTTAGQISDGDWFTLGNTDGQIISVTSNIWGNPTTWNCNCVPGILDDVIIDATHLVEVAADQSALKLEVNSTGSLRVTGGSTLTIDSDILFNSSSNGSLVSISSLDISGNFTNGGSFSANDGVINVAGNWINSSTFTYSSGNEVIFDGASSSQSIDGDTDWYNLTINNTSTGVNFNSGTHNIENVFDINTGAVSNSANVVLLSTSSSTAQMADINSGTYTGDITVQRRVEATTQGYRMFGSPVQGTSLANWMDDGIIFSGFPGSNYPTFFGGANAYFYNESLALNSDKEAGWYVPTDISDATTPTLGTFIYTDAVTYSLSVTGQPYTGDYDINVTSGNLSSDQRGWNLITNPYACNVDWDLFHSDNSGVVDDAYWIYNGTSGQLDAYYDGFTSDLSNVFAHSQGIWVHAITSSGQITFEEEHKSTSSANYVKSINGINEDVKVSISGNVNGYYDNAYLKADSIGTSNYDQGLDFFNILTPIPDYAPSVYFISDDSLNLGAATINNSNSVSLMLQANAGTLAQGNYTLTFENLAQFMIGSCISLEDLHTGDVTDLRLDSTYTFASDPTATFPRFLIHINFDYQMNVENVSCNGGSDGQLEVIGSGMLGNYFNIYDSGDVLIDSLVATNDTILFSNLEPGSYYLSSNSNGNCSLWNQDVVVVAPPEVVSGFSMDTDTLFLDQSSPVSFLNTSLGASNYMWDFGDGSISYDENPVYMYSNPGVFSVTLYADNQNIGVCTDFAVQELVVLSSISNGLVSEFDFNCDLFNSNNNILFNCLSSNSERLKIEVFDVLGKIVFSDFIQVNGNTTYSIPNINLGGQIYIVRLSNSKVNKVFKVF